jgi:hypothetical protein
VKHYSIVLVIYTTHMCFNMGACFGVVHVLASLMLWCRCVLWCGACCVVRACGGVVHVVIYAKDGMQRQDAHALSSKSKVST